MADIARYNRDQARLRDLGYAVDDHFELTLDDLVDFFLRMKVLVNGRAALEIVVRKRHALRVEIPSVPARQTLNDIEAVGVKENHLWRRELPNYRRLKEPESDVGLALSESELLRLESVARTNDLWEVAYCAELLAANTGLRGGEIKKLRLGSINLEARSIQVTRESTKTNKGARRVELNQPALAAVSRLYHRAELLGAGDPEHFLLPADLSRHTKDVDPLKGGRGFDPTQHQMSWDTAWRRLRKAAGLGKLRFHNLRHTFITRMAELGVPLQVTQAAVGHMGDAITKHYTHISNDVARNAVEKLEAIRKAPHFVDVLVDVAEGEKPKLLN